MIETRAWRAALAVAVVAMAWGGLGAGAASAQQTVDEDFDLEEDAEDRDVADTSAAEREDDDVDLMTDDMDAARLGDEQALVEEQVGVEQTRSTLDPFEERDESYFFLGGFYRHTFQPEWMLNWFFERSEGTDNGGGGLEFTWRKNSFSVVTDVWYLQGKTEGAYQANGDPLDEIEWIDSDLSLIFASATFLWSTDFNDVFALEYGVGVGIGVIFGDLTRTEAYPVNAVNEDGTINPAVTSAPYAPCNGIQDPYPVSQGGMDLPQFCDDMAVGSGERGGHFGVAGDVPPVFPWISLPHIALRIKPIAQLMIRIEGGFSTTGPFAGGSLAFGF